MAAVGVEASAAAVAVVAAAAAEVVVAVAASAAAAAADEAGEVEETAKVGEDSRERSEPDG